MKWRTGISKEEDGNRVIYGEELKKLVEQYTFTDAAFLLLRGKLPMDAERKLFDAVLVAIVEHGIEAPSAFVPRTVASTGNPMNAALAAGVLTIGDWHGGAIEQAMRILGESLDASEIVRRCLEEGRRLSGYGHKHYKDADPRAQLLLKKAEEQGFRGVFIARAVAVEEELREQKGKKLPLNVDGAIAAILLELGFDWRLGKAIFVLGRMPGMIAHAHEEIVREEPYRRLDADDVVFEETDEGA